MFIMTKLFHQIKKLIKYVKELVNEHGIPYQSDMFGGGGTDAGNAHLEKGGRLALVLGIPLRYCHWILFICS